MPAVIPPHLAKRLDERLKLLTAELALSQPQQQGVRRVLESQRAQVIKVWNDSSLPAAYRVSVTRTISDRTVEQIRSLLTEEQKLKYNRSRKPRESQAEASGQDLESWMKATSSR